MSQSIIQTISAEHLKDSKLPAFSVGDSVKVFVRIKEGDKERVQAFAGTVIARDGVGHTETFTVRRISYGEGVERIFPVCSRSIEKLEVERSGAPRRAKLYYLRGRSGKKLKIREGRAKAGAESANASA
ncbi:MAG: 50S ribosomal protein L19 [Kiritimatiellae bacterium]|nr:50S ribosomal protein L19 [Kiritimatiellia bacterium]MCO5062751.1 50S ribosomal protein L19 [Kiritimatiellia bacterium]MCO5067096.1 50S ribosomal protein L19 [Kiritimatiellia bacterium]MCO6401257.1 50S ribosomal protein L19 [Verrucomicrobiota bacterium]